MVIHHKTCVIEMTPPRVDSSKYEEGMKRFVTRFQRVMESDFIASISDNVMGIPHVQPRRVIEELSLVPRENQVIVHINTFHTKEDLDETLAFCKERNIGSFLCLSGDGSPELPKLSPKDLGASEVNVVTSVELVKYVKRQYPKAQCGVAFNPYEDSEKEFAKMRRKVEAGADFVITQPILGENKNLRRLLQEFPNLPVIVECWFSKNIKLLAEITGEDLSEDMAYDGFTELLRLRNLYPGMGNCMSMINFKEAYEKVEELWQSI